jgi:hypothetical protein
VGSRFSQLVIDAADPVRLGHWWAEVLDYKMLTESAEETEIGSGSGGGPTLIFVPVPQPKTVQNRLHIDLRADDQDAEVERLVNMGARHVDVGQGDVSWVVLADPEGNEFCVLAGAAGTTR